MGTLLTALKTLKLWQMAVLAVVLAGAIGASYGAYALISGPGGGDLANDQQVIPVQYGDVVNQVSTNGSLVFPTREALAFGTQGTVAEVLVAEGQQADTGQVLARLDLATVSSLEKAVTQAQINLRNAEGALERLLTPTAQEIAQAEAALTSAKLSLKSAQEALAKIQAGPTEEDIARAQSQVASASGSLASAMEDLKFTQKEWDAKAQTARDTLAAAVQAYTGMFQRWLGIQLADGEEALSPSELLSLWGADLSQLFAPSLRFGDLKQGWSAAGVPSNDPSTPWNEQVVYTWLNIYPGPIAPTCEDGTAPQQGLCIEKEMDDSWNAYQNAQDNLDAVANQATKAIANAESAVTRAQETLTAAEESLAILEADPDSLEVESKERQRAVAQANLAKAEDDLAKIEGDADLLEVALKKAEVAAAQLALETALQRLENAALRASMSGVVSLVNVAAGQMVNASTIIVEIVDPTIIEVDGIVDEIDVLFVRPGARADVTMDALPGQVLEGTVSAIASAARSQQGVVSYPIRIQVHVPDGVQLREGLSATASIVIREESNVLRVPIQALYGTFEQPAVKVMSNGRVEERAVVLGNSDDYWVAIRQGLSAGEQVVMETTQATTSQFGFAIGGGSFRQLQSQGPGTLPGGTFQRQQR